VSEPGDENRHISFGIACLKHYSTFPASLTVLSFHRNVPLAIQIQSGDWMLRRAKKRGEKKRGDVLYRHAKQRHNWGDEI